MDDVVMDSYLLVPEAFQERYGESIHERCYDGYGNFGKYDIYELIPEWNREFIPEAIKRMKEDKWYCSTTKSEWENLEHYYKDEKISCPLRNLGIILACYDEDNASLMYPIKITSKPMKYETAAISKGDPNQGWRM